MDKIREWDSELGEFKIWEDAPGPGCSKWVVVTTINAPTTAIEQLARLDDWCMVVVGDKKTPVSSFGTNVVYLSPPLQIGLPYNIIDHTPWNHFGRKAIGYLYAIHHGAEVIYDTDDDNQLLSSPPEKQVAPSYQSDVRLSKVWNPYPTFGAPNTWPRGFPLDAIRNTDTHRASRSQVDSTNVNVCVVQSLVNHDPDVDGIYRLTPGKLPFSFDADTPQHVVQRGVMTPFNAQATLFYRPCFWGLLLPITVHGRVSDIWRSYFMQSIMQASGHSLAFHAPWFRNPHNYLADFDAELPLYSRSGSLVEYLLGREVAAPLDIPTELHHLAVDMYERGVIEEEDVRLVHAWTADLTSIGYFTQDGEGKVEEEVEEGGREDTEEPVERDPNHYLLVMMIPSVRPDRRRSLRNSWLTACDPSFCTYRFFVDPNPQYGETLKTLALENEEHGDLIIGGNVSSGMAFGARLLFGFTYMLDRYDFDFFLRIDDDTVPCMELYFNELRLRVAAGPLPMMISGYHRCKGGSRVDEAFLTVSAPLVEHIVSRTDTLKCGAYGGRTFASWIYTSELNSEIVWHHRKTWIQIFDKKQHKGLVCRDYIGVHKVYPGEIERIWEERDANVTLPPEDLSEFFIEDCPRTPPVGYPTQSLVNKGMCVGYKTSKKHAYCGKSGCKPPSGWNEEDNK